MSSLISARRECVQTSYKTAENENKVRFLEGDPKATSEYIYANQKLDALRIVEKIYAQNFRVTVIQKKVKVGADGLMIELATLLTTHNDDAFVKDYRNLRILTGMSNAAWEKDLIEKAPTCFKNKIFHHGQLKRSELAGLKNAIIIIDEIDSGDKENQVLHRILKEADILNVNSMAANNNHLIFISATPIKELHDLYQWGPLCCFEKMTIPPTYIGGKEFIERKIVQEWYPLTQEGALKWVQEDVLPYGLDYRVHIVRASNKTINNIMDACVRLHVSFKNHTSTDRLTQEDQDTLFNKPLSKHIVLIVKGLLRRANLIPNKWKLRIGAVHEHWTNNVDYSTQNQGLIGRMHGHWKQEILAGHKTGPFRTSIKAIQNYENCYENPLGENTYHTTGFHKEEGKITSSQPTILTPKNIPNLTPIELPEVHPKESQQVVVITISEEDAKKITSGYDCSILLQKYAPELSEKFSAYKHCLFNVDTNDKMKRWAIQNHLKPNAFSTATNVSNRAEKQLVYYLYSTKLILNPWNGSPKN